MDVVRSAFRPEFLNRLDEILLFKRLEKAQMTGIVDIQLKYLHDLLAGRHIELSLNNDAKVWLADKGYEPAYGARPLKRVIQTELQNKLAEKILSGEVGDESTVKVSVKGEALDFDVSKSNASKKSAA